METSEILHQRITQAAANLAAAERELEAALAVVKASPGAEKQMISTRLESAFTRLAETREVLKAALDDAA